jgi:hypothetical protein
MALTATMVEPTGVPAKIAMIMPSTAQKMEMNAEHSVTDLKLL